MYRGGFNCLHKQKKQILFVEDSEYYKTSL